MATAIFTLVFGVVFVLVGLNFARGERRAAARGRRRLRKGYVAACFLIVALGLVALLLAVPALVSGGGTTALGLR